MSDTLLIRPLVQGDFDRWLPLWQGYNEFYGRSGTTALPSDVTSATWVRFFDPDQPVHALVAEAEGELLGLVHYLYHRSTTSIADICYLQDLFTAEARSEEHTSELQSLMRISYAVFCLKKKRTKE